MPALDSSTILDIENKFKDIFLTQLINAYSSENPSKYISNSPDIFVIPNILLRRINYIYKKISIDKIESNLEIAIDKKENSYEMQSYSGEIYHADLNTIRVAMDKIIVYGINGADFPTVGEIRFAEDNKYYLAVRVLENGVLICYGHPTSLLKEQIEEKKKRAFDREGENAWSDVVNGNPVWYSDLFRINMDSNKKKLVKDLLRISKLYGVPIYLPEFTLNYNYNNYIDRMKNIKDDIVEFNPYSSMFMNMKKVSSSWGFYKQVLIDLK